MSSQVNVDSIINKFNTGGTSKSEERVAVDPRKIEASMGWHTSINVSEAISFRRLDGYYKRLIKGFSKLTHPITYV